MKKATIIVNQVDNYNSMFESLFWDLRNDPDVFFIVENDYPNHGIYKLLPSRKLQACTFGLSNALYKKCYLLPGLIDDLKEKYDSVSVLIHNASLKRTMYPLHLIQLMRKKARFFLLYLDMRNHYWVCNYANYLANNNAFDRVFTIDHEDALKYGYEWCYTPYSIVTVKNDDKVSDTTLYFCGSDAGRMYKIYSVWREARKRGILTALDLANSKQFADFFENDSNVHFYDHLPYFEVLKRIEHSKCIIDIPQKDQTALTLRPYEAVVYNKKLLTNSESIKSFKYYDSRYMQFFERVEDIDWDWVNEDIQVDYKYQGDFSPYNLLAKL